MGTFSVTVDVGDPQGARWEPVEMLVDTGATYTWIPAGMLRRLGIAPESRWEFEIANGQIIERDIAETWVRYDGRRHHTFVVFGDDASSALLGAYTLEGFRLGVDPVNRRLVPIRGLALRG